MTLKQRFAMFPCLMELSDEKLIRMGIDPTEAATVKAEITAEAAEARKAEIAAGITAPTRSAAAAYGALNWNIVAKEAVQGFSTQKLAPLVGVFSTDISGDTVIADNPAAMPAVTVPVVGLATEDAVVENPTDLDDIGSGNCIGVPVKLTVLASAVDFPVSAMWEGHKVTNMVAGAVEVLRRKAVHHVFSQLVATGVTDTAGTTIPACSTTAVPTLDTGWCAGYANRRLSAAIEADEAALIVNRQYFAGLMQENNKDLSLDQLAFEGVYKSGQVDALGANAIGLIAAKNSMAVAMRAPHLLDAGYDAVMQLRDGDTMLPITMVQYYNPAKMKMRVILLTAVGAKRVTPAAATILTAGVEAGAEDETGAEAGAEAGAE